MTLIAMEQAQTKESNAVGNAEQNSQGKPHYIMHSLNNFQLTSLKVSNFDILSRMFIGKR